ncbi:Hypothetical predicted protein [Mytilus galloprovincialis]|uniref:Uncharacterized protein n=1 Tax=Mytilus galloprovincialis TaxID=29158 RepID=A0A8B6H2L3_MYTGA|nr:Hypothetical predicted protein [Mytilus galloprovincialis]
MGVFCKIAVFAVLICLYTVLFAVDCADNSISGNYQETDRTFSKRLLLDDDYHTIINRLNNLTHQVGSLKNEDDALKNEVGSLKNEVGALKNEVEALKKENSFLRNQTVAFLAEKNKFPNWSKPPHLLR